MSFLNKIKGWGQDRSAACVEHLKQWYDVVQHQATVRHGHETPCHWDSLFVLRHP